MSTLLRVGMPTTPTPAAPAETGPVLTDLANLVRKSFQDAKTHRQTHRIDERMLAAMRALRGEYDPKTLADIREFGGSEVYARVVATKVRGVSAMLREIYTAAEERPWSIDNTPDPDLIGPSTEEMVAEVMALEEAEAAMMGAVVPPEKIVERRRTLTDLVTQQRLKAAKVALRLREAKIDDYLVEGGFYSALWDFLQDVAAFPLAVLKGPVVRMTTRLRWENGRPTAVREPAMFWERCSPFDVYFSPWSSSPQDGYIIHYQRVTREALRALRDLPGGTFNREAIDRVLTAPAGHVSEWNEWVEQERADLEQRASQNDVGFNSASERPYAMLEYHGRVEGRMLTQWGMPDASETEDVDVVLYFVANEIIGARRNLHPMGQKPFYVESFERVPGSIYGNGIHDLIEDVAAVCNATLRAMVNNMAMGSGPMGYVNTDRLAEDETSTNLHPWRMFRVTDPANGNNTLKPVEFFQPNTNAQEMFYVYEKFLQQADEQSALPRYMQGGNAGSGAGRTASGLSMLMDAASRTIKQTVASIDQNVIEPAVEDLNIYLALTRPDVVNDGDISVVARGAAELAQRETLRMRRIEFLQATANPLDANAVPLPARAAVLREVARDLGLPVDEIVPAVATMPSPMGQPPAAGPTPPNPGEAPAEQPPNPVQGMAVANTQ